MTSGTPADVAATFPPAPMTTTSGRPVLQNANWRNEVAKARDEREMMLQAEVRQRQALREKRQAERQAKWEEFSQQPKVQDMQDQRQMARDSRMTPEQRLVFKSEQQF